VHPAAAVRHGWRLAKAPAPCSRSTPLAQVHRQLALHGVDPVISFVPLPVGLDRSDNRLPSLVNVNVLNGHFLLTFAPMTIKRVQQHRTGAAKLVRLT
jgi:hypothetical protein